MLAARLLAPREFGGLTALFGIILVGSVASLGLQAVTARRLAVAPTAQGEIIATTVRVTVMVASRWAWPSPPPPVLTPALKPDSYWPIILCGATLVPMTVMGAQTGIAQGTTRWGSSPRSTSATGSADCSAARSRCSSPRRRRRR